MSHQLLMQAFEWYLPADAKHWQRLKSSIPELQQLGVSQLWLPPAFKGTSSDDVGYGVYDLFDLGEFDQNGTVSTKYGSKEDYLQLIAALKEANIKPIADVVLNHKANGDHKERFSVIKMNPENRQQPLTEPYEIEGWTGFDFPGRQNTYNDFKWHWYHFTGLDYDAKANETGIYMITGDNKGWANDELIDDEHGNFDYLMYNDLDFKHPEVIQNLQDWAKWFIETTGIEGFRLDAVKHIDSYFIQTFINDIRTQLKPDLEVFGEYWKSDQESMEDYLEATKAQFALVDVALHMSFFNASQQGADFDLTTIFDGSLVASRPDLAVTFVENHDTQRGQALESTVEEWFKPLAYGLILLRQEGKPCLFYGDYYGISGDYPQQSFKEVITKMAELRQELVYGEQVDYFDHANCIGWIFLGADQRPQPLAVVLSNGDAGWKHMEVGQAYAGQVFCDFLDNCQETVVVDEDGWADFKVEAGSISAWVLQKAQPKEEA
ncbi:TPA: alpha-amylase [Streptococcus equi subsp. zooepidemicus]|uniref:alpha-amylase n=1 Tax=Streptococcus equi TaxID=1336 RepID=UPI0013DBA133|nr:alpha-amylase [Streptococcus equi]MDI5988558.1 alpha-amylase [Streptococcus equi subsp. zooepidemicus]HEL0559315.1 alpha-amylase [Streptococcus equi subsp. zooepidemicus]HEL0608835.1 alpha-amylase [Streptococcus equi subsp. zooepidemicus]HEL0629025.1 alpha-amylase [Streptococcus equi subsp. zooepidemicus]HEL0781712.1 alpha-amylase [Streptococcus equi subsp. zooepidemicus]